LYGTERTSASEIEEEFQYADFKEDEQKGFWVRGLTWLVDFSILFGILQVSED